MTGPRSGGPPARNRPHGRRWEILVANVKARGEACCRCGQRIDMTLLNPHPESFSVDHFPYPIASHPWLAEDPGNLHAAHLLCNQEAGHARPAPDLGTTSEAW